jgi:hypothetical protein
MSHERNRRGRRTAVRQLPGVAKPLQTRRSEIQESHRFFEAEEEVAE